MSNIDIGLNSPLLNDDMIILDSAGISDVNSTRVASAVASHRQCSHKIHVMEVGRALSDKHLASAMADAYRRRGSRNTVLVLTHGDEIDKETIVGSNAHQRAMVQREKDEVDALHTRIRKLRMQLPRTTQDRQFQIEDELETTIPEHKQKERELKASRLRMRNDYIKTTIQKTYKQLSGDPHPLPIYVVANDTYQEYQAGYHISEKPILTVEQTEAPALRRQLYTLPTEGKLNDALHLAFHQLPSLINSFELYPQELIWPAKTR